MLGQREHYFPDPSLCGCLPDARQPASSDGQQPENIIMVMKPSSQDKNKRKGKYSWLVGLILTMNNTKDKGKKIKTGFGRKKTQ